MPDTDFDLTPGGADPIAQMGAFYRIYAVLMENGSPEGRREAAAEMVAYGNRITAISRTHQLVKREA